MPLVTTAVGLCVCLAAATTALAQPLQPRRLVGTLISSHFETNGATQNAVHYTTLTFSDADGAPAFTVDFVAHYQGVLPASPPRVVDMVITQLVSTDEHPDVAMRVDGEALPLIPRLRSRRSVVASVPFQDFVKLANGQSIVERAFDTELEFGAGQMRMLRSVAQQWAGR